MSATANKKAPLPDDIRATKGGTPLVCLTAYTTPMAQMMDMPLDHKRNTPNRRLRMLPP
jgi:3-methyl-2-oxobutanoate hydroxymethyltransferase